jgi:hypothetical protein
MKMLDNINCFSLQISMSQMFTTANVFKSETSTYVMAYKATMVDGAKDSLRNKNHHRKISKKARKKSHLHVSKTHQRATNMTGFYNCEPIKESQFIILTLAYTVKQENPIVILERSARFSQMPCKWFCFQTGLWSWQCRITIGQ